MYTEMCTDSKVSPDMLDMVYQLFFFYLCQAGWPQILKKIKKRLRPGGCKHVTLYLVCFTNALETSSCIKEMLFNPRAGLKWSVSKAICGTLNQITATFRRHLVIRVHIDKQRISGRKTCEKESAWLSCKSAYIQSVCWVVDFIPYFVTKYLF